MPAAGGQDGNVAGPGRYAAPVPPTGTGVRGRVVSAAGAPVDTATVTAAATGRPGGPVSQEANVTAADGTYFRPLPPGSWEITVSRVGFRPHTERVVVPAGPAVVLDVALRPDPAD
jgi:hypothetical protein